MIYFVKQSFKCQQAEADPGFPREGANPKGWIINLSNFPELSQEGGGRVQNITV